MTFPAVRIVLLREALTPIAGFGAVFAVLLWVASFAGWHVLGHSPYDSYTLEALAWRDGHAALSENYPWLELAVYHGQYWVSFPPVPAVPLYFLTFLFGEDTPSGAMVLLYFFVGLGAIYALLRRHLSSGQATGWMLFVALGGSILSIVSADSATGGVWFQAQVMAFMFTALALLLADGGSKRGWAGAFACLALAVGCRPFNAIDLPLLLLVMSRHMEFRWDGRALARLVAPAAVIGGAYAAYNAARFGNPLEFGHKYLPELKQTGQPMFALSRVPGHFVQVLGLPKLQEGKLTLPITGGFAVYLTNPMILVGLFAILTRAVRRRADLIDLVLVATILVHGALLLSHRTNGGWQYGTRYLIDLLPVVTYAMVRGGGLRIRNWGAMAMGALIAFNVYGTIVFQAV